MKSKQIGINPSLDKYRTPDCCCELWNGLQFIYVLTLLMVIRDPHTLF